MRLRLLLLSCLLVLPLAACSDGGNTSDPVELDPPTKTVTKPVAAPTKALSPAPIAAEAAPDPFEALRANYSAAMLDPKQATETAPASYTVKFATTKGDMLIDVTRAWAPNGADRFYNLVQAGFYDDVAVFRVIGGFMAQLGISNDPKVSNVWRTAKIQDDPVKESNKPGYLTFAMAGPNTRTTQIFFNFVDNSRLDGMGFAPFGKLRDLDVLNKLYAGYGEGAPRGRGPHQGLLQSKGGPYLKDKFPMLDYVTKATIVTQ
jgi:peptidyl-prolyl cis-trans isomerase A (cyclophilin A)